VVVEPAHQWQFDYLARVWDLHWPWHRAIVIEGPMRTDVVRIFEVTLKTLVKLPFVKDDHPIQAFVAKDVGAENLIACSTR